MTRDNFTNKVKIALAHRAGHCCSNPKCGKPTSGPSSVETEFVNTGKAAHIIAAAPGGPRADASLSPAERKSISNGLWLCGICADVVDKDDSGHEVATLRQWKKDAEEHARLDAFTSRRSIPQKVVFELDDKDKEFFQNLALAPEETTDVIAEKMADSARENIETHRNDRRWPGYVVDLNLTAVEKSGNAIVTLVGLAQGILTAEAINIISQPGTGKSISLIRLAETILDAGKAVAAYIPLGEWADRPETWFDFLRRQHAFRSFKDDHFKRLAYDGRLVLLLDGWNELNSDARIRALHDLEAIKREFPIIGIVIGTRQQALPINGAIVEIESLNDTQQMELARKLRGKDGEALVHQAWRSPGVRELISIPLYLTALLTTTVGATFPQTKEEVLSRFVSEHENEADKAEILRSKLFDSHKDMLIALGVAANNSGGTSIPDTEARSVITKALKSQEAQGQLAAGLQPATVLDVLVDTHLLVRASSGGSLLFQHQQFQEWYASFEVERLMIDALKTPAGQELLRSEILNWPAWEESILFACERLSRADSVGREAVSAAILETLGIDPMLAAEMIFRSAPEVWSQISDKVTTFARRWHSSGKVDRAVRFMITTGRPEFSEEIWPLISSDDNQIHLRVLRLAGRFRPSVLGPDVEKRLAELPDKIRGHVIAEIGMNSGYDGMELATRLAKREKDAESVLEIIHSLAFRRATQHVTDIVVSAAKSVWQLIAKKGYPEEIDDKAVSASIHEMRRELVRTEADPITALGYLNLGWEEEEKTPSRLKSLLESKDFPMKNDNARTVIWQAAKKYPKIVAEALLNRAASGLDTMYGINELVDELETVDEGPIATAALRGKADRNAAPILNSAIGPVTVGKLIDEFIRLDEEYRSNGSKYSQAASAEYHRVKDAITTSRQSSFIPALLERAGMDQPTRIKLLAELLARHGKETESKPLVLDEETERHLVAAIDRWIDILLPSGEANRHQLSVIAEAIQRVPNAQFTPKMQKMLERDLTDWARAREEHFKLRSGNTLTRDVTHSYTLQYRRSFSAIGDENVVELMKGLLPDPRFGFDAACVLMDIWNRDHPSGKDKRFSGWHDYSDAKTKRARLTDTEQEPSSSEFSEAIFAVVRDLAKLENDKEAHHHALRLGKIAMAMPYGRKREDIDALLNLPQPFAAKRELFTAAAMMGEVISADMLLAAFNELLAAGVKEPWRLEERHGEVMNWVELFAFSDRPAAVLGILDQLPQEYRYPHHLRRLLTALKNSPHPDSMKILQAMAAQNPKLTEENEWLAAIVDQKSPEAGQLLLDLICDGTIKLSGAVRGWGVSKQLTGYAAHYPAIRAEILKRYEQSVDGPVKSILEGALIEVADAEFILMLIDNMAKTKRTEDGRLSRAIEKLALEQRPVEGWPGAFEQFSVALTKLRIELFALFMANDARSELAEVCLNKIEKLRDEHGRINHEPRHPDITSNLSWPKEASIPTLPVT